jgi:hypothetical protein
LKEGVRRREREGEQERENLFFFLNVLSAGHPDCGVADKLVPLVEHAEGVATHSHSLRVEQPALQRERGRERERDRQKETDRER